MVVQSKLVFSTRDIPRDDQFDAWRSFMAPVVEMELVGPSEPGFIAEQTVWNLGSLVFTRAILPGIGHRRRFRHLSKNSLDHWCLVVSEAYAPDEPRPGRIQRQLGMRSLARPFEGEAEDHHVVSLFIPRDLFGGAASSLDAVEGEIGDEGICGILTDYLMVLERRLPLVEADEFGSVAEATRALVAACLAPSLDRMVEAQQVVNSTVLERARQAIQRNLHVPSFGPRQLSRMVAVSRSKLYRLFEPVGGVTHYIQRQRLLQSHTLLSDPTNTLTINMVGDRFGFVDPSGFSRAFRKEFGYSPSDARAAALSGFPRSPAPPRNFRAPPAHASPLGACLRSLQA